MSTFSFQSQADGLLVKDQVTGRPLGLLKQVYSEKRKEHLWTIDGQPKVGYLTKEDAALDLWNKNKKMILDPDMLAILKMKGN